MSSRRPMRDIDATRRWRERDGWEEGRKAEVSDREGSTREEKKDGWRRKEECKFGLEALPLLPKEREREENLLLSREPFAEETSECEDEYPDESDCADEEKDSDESSLSC